ncbi:MAG TPA: VWA domain-containing protein [Terriglobales bacterium]|nr:VWA domain-containing protein [Terriglobales bacterium]
MQRPLAFTLAWALGFGSLALFAQGVPQQKGPVIIPKAAPTAPVAPPPPPQQQARPKPQFNFSVTVPEVQIPVTVETKSGQFVPNLTIKQFELFEDGVPQKIEKVNVTNDAPMTVVMLVEFSNSDYYPLLYRMLEASYLFTGQLQPQDWVALVTYDLKPTILVDFTHDKRAVYAGLNSLHFANFSETDLFDSLADTIDRLNGIKGHKTIVLISTGLNSFSHMNFDQLRKKLEATQGITIYSVSMSWTLEEWADENGYPTSSEMNMYQGDNEMRYFATITGGRYYQPRFEGAFNDVFRDIAGAVRSQYTLSYVPTNRKLDGTTRKIKVELVAPNGQPLKLVNQKGKVLKYTINYRDTYTSRHIVQ